MTVAWIIGAAASSGYILSALFVIVAVWRFFKNTANNFIEEMPKRSALRHYTLGVVSLVLFFLLTARACYIATVVVDTAFRSDLFEKIAFKSFT
ncbi:hypothetical protein PY650_28080 [Rhizobium calliandrae]|uniref:Uncharacterized protein n=1 Tax=Rhizobium calliandrae TaxID=1312182 RepID=A0ABT7KLA6_9HYPH|nr:hypothetical protein [Rhizobium calliandrae]MDL2409422.1 hypothetical protein [Rhizobium calliandrae]